VNRIDAGHGSDVTGVAISPDGSRVVSSSSDKTVRVWDLQTGVVLATFTRDGRALCCAFIDDHRIAAGDSGGRMYCLSIEIAPDGSLNH
jgi:WD40 repeat protein